MVILQPMQVDYSSRTQYNGEVIYSYLGTLGIGTVWPPCNMFSCNCELRFLEEQLLRNSRFVIKKFPIAYGR